jgi:hypothetical protein
MPSNHSVFGLYFFLPLFNDLLLNRDKNKFGLRFSCAAFIAHSDGDKAERIRRKFAVLC